MNYTAFYKNGSVMTFYAEDEDEAKWIGLYSDINSTLLAIVPEIVYNNAVKQFQETLKIWSIS